MLRSNVTKILGAAGISVFAAYAATAQEVKNLPGGRDGPFHLFSHRRL